MHDFIFQTIFQSFFSAFSESYHVVENALERVIYPHFDEDDNEFQNEKT